MEEYENDMQEFDNDDDFDDGIDFDAYLSLVSEEAEKINSTPSMLNPKVIGNIKRVKEVMNRVVGEHNVKIANPQDGLVKTMMGLDINKKVIRFNSAHLFSGVARLASAVTIYPRLDGSIQMTFSFKDSQILIDENGFDEERCFF